MGYFNFIGQFDYVMDGKHRLNIPSKFRKQFENDSEASLVLTIGVDKCVNIYTQSLWEAELMELNKLDRNKIENRQFARMIGASATLVNLDKQGRINLPQNLRDYAHLKKDVKIIGVFDKIELWNPADFDNQANLQMQDLSSLATKLSQKND